MAVFVRKAVDSNVSLRVEFRHLIANRLEDALAKLLAFPARIPAGASLVREGPGSYVEADLPSADRGEQARGLQRELRRLAARQARLELRLGGGLEELGSRFDLRELGHSNWDALCTGRLGCSAAHGRELRKLSARLADLPSLRAVFVAGLVPRTRVRAVLDVATAEDEAAWAQLALGLSTRELRARVRAVRAARSSAPEGACALAEADEDEDFVTLRWLATPADRATWEFGLAMLRQVVGQRGPRWKLLEALAAETLAGLGPVAGGDADEAAVQACVRSRVPGSRGRVRALSRAPRGRQALRKLRRALRRAAEQAPAEPADFESCASAWEVLDELLRLVQQLTVLESERARLLSWLQGRSLYRELGHRRFHDFLERETGLGPRQARELIELQSVLSMLPETEAAWRTGAITTQQARRLAEVAALDTESEWLRFAAEVTPKLLDAAVHRLRVVETGKRAPLPPWDRPLRALLLDWQEHFGLRRRRELRAAEGACAPGEPIAPVAGRRVGWIRVRAPRAVARLFAEGCAGVRAAAGTVLSVADCLRRMLGHFLAVHVSEEVLAHARRHRAIERDGWTCQMPHCRSHGPFHEHHRRFRSAGGSDEPWNLVTLCAPCHAMLHAGHVTILGRAPDGLTFLLGARRERYAGERRMAEGLGAGRRRLAS